MIFYTVPYVLAAFLLMLALHIAALLFHDPVGKILSYVNIGLHIVFVFLLLLGKVPLEESVLLYMISVTVYLFGGALSARIGAKKAGSESDADAAEESGEAPDRSSDEKAASVTSPTPAPDGKEDAAHDL